MKIRQDMETEIRDTCREKVLDELKKACGPIIL